MGNTTYLNSYRRTTDKSTMDTGVSPVPELAQDGYDNASFQDYLLRFRPQMIVNDSVSIFSEFTTGHNYGGVLGDSPGQYKSELFGDALYPHNFNSSSTSLLVTQFYAELYTDTGTFRVGRHNFHWGHGAIFNSGEGLSDRAATIHDGLTAIFKIGSIRLIPYYSKFASLSTLTNADEVYCTPLSVLKI